MRSILKGDKLVSAEHAFDITASRKHGAVKALIDAFKRLGMVSLISSKPSPQRDLVCAMIAARIMRPHTQLATWRWWDDTTLGDYFHLRHTGADDLYKAMDWLLKRQNVIEGKLVRRHLQRGALALFGMSSTYLEGSRCPLAEFGYSRDGKKGRLQVNFALLCDLQGRPLSVRVCRGSLRDSQTLIPEIRQLQNRFGIKRLVVVGDRGMVTQVDIDALAKMDGLHWISALKSVSIRKLLRDGGLPMARFDEVNLFEILHPDYPTERLIACRSRQLAKKRAAVRNDLLQATEKKLDAVVKSVAAGRLRGAAEIALKVGEVINACKVKKHFICEISEQRLDCRKDEDSIALEAALDGVCVIRTSLDAASMSAGSCVRNYKRLADVERAFRCIKTVSLQVRPVHHRTAARVRAHIFLCMLACYVEWRLRQAWKPLLFSDPHLDQINDSRDPVKPLTRSREARNKASAHKLDDGSPACCFRTLVKHLETMTRNRCVAKSPKGDEVTFELDTSASDKQLQALELLDSISSLPEKNTM